MINKKILFFASVVLLTVGLLLWGLEKSRVTNFYNKPASSIDNANAVTTSKAPSAQADFTDGNARSPKNDNKIEGVVIDKDGAIQSIPQEKDWIKSSSGELILYYPQQNSVINNKSIISGKSKGDKVSFRLIDNVNGVIAQGDLNVVNGQYSGELVFETAADLGRVDVFNVKPDGTETNNIVADIRYK